MDSIVKFHFQETDGKPFLVIKKPELHPIPQTQSPTSSVEQARHDHPHDQPIFLCPIARWQKERRGGEYPLTSSPEYVLPTSRFQPFDGLKYPPSMSSPEYVLTHPVVPLFWCNNKEFDFTKKKKKNNKEFDLYEVCGACSGAKFGTDYYFCESHELKYHKECVESPLKIKHPYHPQHPLQLWYSWTSRGCYCCRSSAYLMLYCCFICNVSMHPICAMQPVSFLTEKPKRHDHPLSLFTRKKSLVCNVCGSPSEIHPTYICARCDFVAHKDCMSSPTIIKISRHHHRISYTSSLQSKEWSCGVCRQSIDNDYGAYTCGKCSDYVVHSRCALDKDVWDGEELDGVPDEDDLIEDVVPFEIISEGVIRHFLHKHDLLLKIYMLYDEKKLCQVCVLPIYEGNFYSCNKCDFILHDSCANAPRMIQHALHPHPLALRGDYYIRCDACYRRCNGFGYMCPRNRCSFELDVRCASISEPFQFKDHEHALFLALNPKQRPTCQVCKEECRKQLNCIKCDFIVCFKCASLPYKVRYKHDEHLLTLLWGKEAYEKDWCEVCENELPDAQKTFYLADAQKTFYSCKECCTFLHTKCLLGRNPYLKPGHPAKNMSLQK